MAVRFVYFDIGNVLCTFSHQKMCAAIADIVGTAVEEIESEFDDGIFDCYEHGQISTRQLLDRLGSLGVAEQNDQALTHAIADIFALNEPIVDLVQQLAGSATPLGILSNTNEVHWKFLTSGRFHPVLPGSYRETALSFEIGAMKPAAAIFAAAEQLAGVPPHEIFFTDDKPENVAAARDRGWDAVLFTTAPSLRRDFTARGLLPGSPNR